MPTKAPPSDDLGAALQTAGADLIMAAGMIFSEEFNRRPPPAEALHRANMAIGNAREAMAAYERARRPIAA